MENNKVITESKKELSVRLGIALKGVSDILQSLDTIELEERKRRKKKFLNKLRFWSN